VSNRRQEAIAAVHESPVVQVFGHAAMSDLNPSRTKAEVARHHDMARAGSLLPCADRRCSVVGLIIGSVQPKCRTQMELR